MKRSVLAGLAMLLAGQAAFAAAGPEMILLGKGRPPKGPDAGAGFNALAGALHKIDGTVHVDATGKGTSSPARPEPERAGSPREPGPESNPRP